MVLGAMADGSEKCAEHVLDDAVRQLIGSYPAREVTDAKTLTKGIKAMFGAYPFYAVQRVVNPVTGLASRLKFFPTLAEVREALDAEMIRRGRIARNCKHIIDAEAKAAEDREFERNRLPAEDRARRAQEILANTPFAMPPYLRDDPTEDRIDPAEAERRKRIVRNTLGYDPVAKYAPIGRDLTRPTDEEVRGLKLTTPAAPVSEELKKLLWQQGYFKATQGDAA